MAVPLSTRAQTTDLESKLELLQSLMKQVEALQAQLAALRGDIGDIRNQIRTDLREGVEDEDVKAIQELLATDQTLYPKGIVSGYYGPLTTEAIKRFQERYGLTVTGEVNDETRALLQELFKERQNGKFPPGLLKAPGIEKKIKDRLYKNDDDRWELRCDDSRASGLLCKADDKTNKKRDGRATSTTSAISSSAVAAAIEKAQGAIDDLAEAIETASSSVDADDIDDAEEDLVKAKRELAAAQKYAAALRYKDAYNRANKAYDTALDAIDDLEKVEDESDDSEDEDDDEDDDEDEDD